MRILYAILLTATLAVAQTSILIPQVYSSGALGITPGQTAKWTVVNVRLPDPVVTPACSLTLSFRNEQGQELKIETVSVAPGETRSLSLDASTELATGGNRTTLYGVSVIPVTGPADQPQRLCNLVHSMEIFENGTGKTAVLTPGTRVNQPLLVFPTPLPGSTAK